MEKERPYCICPTSKPLREWMRSVQWPENAPDWSLLRNVDCISLKEALSMIAASSTMPITTRRYYKGAFAALDGESYNEGELQELYEAAKQGYEAGLTILEAQKANSREQSPTVPRTVAYISVAPDDYERMSRRDAAWSEMIEKLRTLSGAVADLVLQMEKLK